MSMPMPRQRRKNPVLRTRQLNIPPASRGRPALGLMAGAAVGEFRLQTCDQCSTVQYPPRDACVDCLSTDLTWHRQNGVATVLSVTTLRHSNDLYFKERLPWHIGLVQLDSGPSVIVHLQATALQAGSKVLVKAMLDKAGQAVLVAGPPPGDEGELSMSEDAMLKEFRCDPRNRRVLVTDGMSPVGQACVRALVKAGAEVVWVGYAEPWKRHGSGLDALADLEPVTLVPLDVTDERSIATLAGSIGAKVDIVVNTAEVHRTNGIGDRKGTDAARQEMDVNYFGLLRLAQSFAPVLKARSADGELPACAWVNLLSVFGLSNFPPHGTYSASKAAAHSLSQCLRAEFRSSGIRVVNVFPGPVDDDWTQSLPPPKVAPAAIAHAIVEALCEGTEDVYPGDVAQEWFERWRSNPKVLEREIAAGGLA